VSPDTDNTWSRIGRCLIDSRPRIVTWIESAWHPLPPSLTDPIKITAADLSFALSSPPLGAPLSKEPREFCVPLDPGKVIGVGLNYRSHAIEVGAAIPKNPLLFAKFNTALIGHGATIRVNESVTRAADWEVELAVIVGRTLHCASREEAQRAIFGYTVANDVTARDIQTSDVQWTRSKSLDTFGPLGPWIVPPSAIDPANAKLRAYVNGTLMQDGTTSDLIFDVPELLSFCSWSFTLQAGDVILTGTPPGVGAFRKPPIALRHGDVVDVEVEGIGRLSNSIEIIRPHAR
jgi:2-keto-4-pentenoate hydratase/2-oxohepta-3-ene-1,7-dioic acid hydratase in catechol pathway